MTLPHMALTMALQLADAGYHLAPVTIRRNAAGRKVPDYHRLSWTEVATTDPDTLTAWSRRYGRECGFLIACEPSGLVGIDLDMGSHDAVAWWAAESLPCADLIVDTPSGGQHHYWRMPDQPVPNSAGAIAAGVDVRGLGGHLYAPGTTVVGDVEPYRLTGPLIAPADLALLPAEILKRIPQARRRARTRTGDSSAGCTSHDEPWVIRECARQLGLVSAMPATGGAGFRNVLLGAAMVCGRAVAAGLVPRYYAEQRLRESVEAVWGAPDAADIEWIETGLDDGEADPWTVTPDPTVGSSSGAADDPEKRDLVEQRYLFRRADQAARERIEREDAPEPLDLADLAVWDTELQLIDPPTMVIDSLLPDRSVGWLGGPSGSYKSFIGVSLAAALSYGIDALDFPDFRCRRPVKVLYVAGEDASGVALRMLALRRARDVSGAGRRFVLYPRAVDLSSEPSVIAMIEFILQNDIGWVIIDTFRQSTLGVNENDNTEVGMVLSRMLALRDDHGVGCTLIDHTNKNGQGLADLGGAGAKRANADYVLMADLTDGNRAIGAQRLLRVAKLKSQPDGGTWPITLKEVPEVTDVAGGASAMVVIGAAPAGRADIHGDYDWRFVELPDVVREYDGQGREHLSTIAQLVIHYGSGASGISRAEVARYYHNATPTVSATCARLRVMKAWDALHVLKLLISVSPTSTSRIGHHRWRGEIDK